MLINPLNTLLSKTTFTIIFDQVSSQDSFNVDNASFVAAEITASEAFGK